MSSARQTQRTAILTMVAAMACLSTQDTFSKKQMPSLAPVIIIWTRYGLQTALVCATLWRRGSPELWRTRQWNTGFQTLTGYLARKDSPLTIQLCTSVLAFSRAPASVLSPYLFSAIGFSALGGWWVFDPLPDAPAICGMLMIAGFGLAAGWLNQRTAPE